MPWLFSYGTLQEEPVQLSTFGRRLSGEHDALVGFEPALVKIDDPAIRKATGRTHHANAVPSETDQSRVDGTVFEVTDAELADADEFEKPFAYKRIAVKLASGRDAFVYVFCPKDVPTTIR